MNHLRMASALVGALTLGLAIAPMASALHGGTYRGPGDTVPPGGGNGGGGGGGVVSPGPTGPNAPGTTGPTGPGATSPGGAGRGPGGLGAASSGGASAGSDLSVWDFWWGFNKEPYLNLRARVRGGGVLSSSDDFFLGRGMEANALGTRAPSPETIRDVVVPALLEVLAKEHNNDILTGTLIALAKIGDERRTDGTSEIRSAIEAFLDGAEQEIAETAAIALGILADDAAAPTLIALARNDEEGQRRVGRTTVPPRTQAFAAYGLGLVAARTEDNALRQQIAAQALSLLDASATFARPDVPVAAVASLGLVALDPAERNVAEAIDARYRDALASRGALVDALLARLEAAPHRAGWIEPVLVRAQLPLAIGRLLGQDRSTGGSDLAAARTRAIEVLVGQLDRRSGAKEVEILQSCALALGMLGDAGSAPTSGAVVDALTVTSNSARQPQTRFFALMALAQVGARAGAGEEPRALQAEVQKRLLQQLATGKGQARPWAALALGVFGHALNEGDGVLDLSVRSALREVCRTVDSPDEAGAYALALGLIQDIGAEELLLERLDAFQVDSTRGYVAVGLGMMQARHSTERLVEIVEGSKFRPELLRHAATGLGLLGDRSAARTLVEMLRSARGLSAQASIATALGTIGDADSVEPLIALLRDESVTDTARGFAAAALGIVCDKEMLPWSTRISENVNYRINVPTLTSPGGTGILDIL